MQILVTQPVGKPTFSRKNVFRRLRYLSFALLMACLPLLASDAVAQTSAKSENASAGQTPEKPATLLETLADIKAFSKRIDGAEDQGERIDAAVDLSALYLRILSDPRFSISEKLQGYRGRIASRLKREQRLIERAQRKLEKQKAKQKAKRRGDDSLNDVGGEAADSDANAGVESSIVDRHWEMLAHSAGATGPSMYYGSGMFGTSGYFHRGRGAGTFEQGGAELVDLVETILHPDFWQPAGGAGTAYYYQPQRILVVRATTVVHEDLTHFLERLR